MFLLFYGACFFLTIANGTLFSQCIQGYKQICPPVELSLMLPFFTVRPNVLIA